MKKQVIYQNQTHYLLQKGYLGNPGLLKLASNNPDGSPFGALESDCVELTDLYKKVIITYMKNDYIEDSQVDGYEGWEAEGISASMEDVQKESGIPVKTFEKVLAEMVGHGLVWIYEEFFGLTAHGIEIAKWIQHKKVYIKPDMFPMGSEPDVVIHEDEIGTYFYEV